MADKNTLRSHRSNDSHRRSDAPETPSNGADPLAELARLIGQPDPYHDSMRMQPLNPTQLNPTQYGRDDAGGWRQHIQRPDYDTVPEEPAHESDARYAPSQPNYAAEPHHDDRHGMAPHGDDRYADPYADQRHDPSYAAQGYPDEPLYADPQHHAGYAEDPHLRGMTPHADDGYDDPPRRRRTGSNGLVTAAVLIGCAVLGTAGAYGYRTYSGSASSGQAPVIIADSAPNKIVPSAEQKSARSQDRVGGQGDERLISREEQPVALPGTSTPSAGVPRVVFPSLLQPGPTTTGTTSPSTANAPGLESKRVRTQTIRPEGGDASARPGAAPPPSARTVPPTARTSRDAPLSLDPAVPGQGNEPARSQQRAPAPRETAQPAPRVASAPSSGGNGGYLVQVSSQKSESDAQASYRGLQSKYSQLKSRQAIIRRADLGTKGVFYRAMVGPFDSSDEAGQFCSGLKQSGGQCIILRN